MTSTEENLTKILTAVKWYQGLQPGYNNVVQLMEARRKLSARLYYLADDLGGLKENQNKTYFDRKSTQAQLKKKYEDGGDNSTKAASQAEVEASELFEKEKNADSLFYRMRYLYEAGKDVMDSMIQDISYLKEEKRNA